MVAILLTHEYSIHPHQYKTYNIDHLIYLLSNVITCDIQYWPPHILTV